MPLAEKVLAKPLSGGEIIEAILHNLKVGFAKQAPRVSHKIVDEFLDRLRKQMKRDCYLNPIIAYAVYSSESTVSVNFQHGHEGFFEIRSKTSIEFPGTNTAIKNTMISLVTNSSEPVADRDLETAEVVVSDIPKAPNSVRVSTEQEVHVRSQTPQGKIEERKVKYAPRKAATA